MALIFSWGWGGDLGHAEAAPRRETGSLGDVPPVIGAAVTIDCYFNVSVVDVFVVVVILAVTISIFIRDVSLGEKTGNRNARSNVT